MTETPFGGVDGSVRVHATPQRGAQAGPEAAPAPVGGVQPPGHHPAGRREGHRRPQLRLRRTRGRQAVGRRLRAGRPPAMRPGGPGGQSPGGLRHTDDVLARREEEALARGLEGANFFGYSLAHYYVFGDHVSGHHQRLAGVPRAPGEGRAIPRGGTGGPSRRSWGRRRRPAITPVYGAPSGHRPSCGSSSGATKRPASTS